jgi:hypothetical protein
MSSSSRQQQPTTRRYTDNASLAEYADNPRLSVRKHAAIVHHLRAAGFTVSPGIVNGYPFRQVVTKETAA